MSDTGPCDELAPRTKHELRRHVLAKRDDVPPDRRAALSAAACARAAALPELVGARSILAFASFGSELDTGPLLTWALDADKRLCLPLVAGPREMRALLVTDLEHDLVPGHWDIPEPRADLPELAPEEIDAVVVPGSMFDPACRRCGYGGGFYDTYLPRTRPGTPRVALAFELQLVDEVPVEPHDLRVDAVVTEARVIRPGSGR